MQWQCRIAPSLGGGFAGTPKSAWGTKEYKNDQDPTVFFGLYGLPDFFALWRHKGRKAILWAGTDVTHFINGYWLDDKGSIRVNPRSMAKWIAKNCESWVENELEAKELKKFGIHARVCPSYLGDVNKVKPTYKPSVSPKAYVSVSGDDFKAYGWDKIDSIAKKMPHMTIYCYGNTKEWKSKQKNVIVRGRVPMKVMDREIKNMQCGMRLNDHDGFSEILAKAVLMEQDVVSRIYYPFLSMGRKQARNWLIKNVNKYPWNTKSRS